MEIKYYPDSYRLKGDSYLVATSVKDRPSKQYIVMMYCHGLRKYLPVAIIRAYNGEITGIRPINGNHLTRIDPLDSN